MIYIYNRERERTAPPKKKKTQNPNPNRTSPQHENRRFQITGPTGIPTKKTRTPYHSKPFGHTFASYEAPKNSCLIAIIYLRISNSYTDSESESIKPQGIRKARQQNPGEKSWILTHSITGWIRSHKTDTLGPCY